MHVMRVRVRGGREGVRAGLECHRSTVGNDSEPEPHTARVTVHGGFITMSMRFYTPNPLRQKGPHTRMRFRRAGSLEVLPATGAVKARSAPTDPSRGSRHDPTPHAELGDDLEEPLVQDDVNDNGSDDDARRARPTSSHHRTRVGAFTQEVRRWLTRAVISVVTLFSVRRRTAQAPEVAAPQADVVVCVGCTDPCCNAPVGMSAEPEQDETASAFVLMHCNECRSAGGKYVIVTCEDCRLHLCPGCDRARHARYASMCSRRAVSGEGIDLYLDSEEFVFLGCVRGGATRLLWRIRRHARLTPIPSPPLLHVLPHSPILAFPPPARTGPPSSGVPAYRFTTESAPCALLRAVSRRTDATSTSGSLTTC